jgi:hypothetical protein
MSHKPQITQEVMSKMDEQRKCKSVCIMEGGKEGRKEEYRRLNTVTVEDKKECMMRSWNFKELS